MVREGLKVAVVLCVAVSAVALAQRPGYRDDVEDEYVEDVETTRPAYQVDWDDEAFDDININKAATCAASCLHGSCSVTCSDTSCEAGCSKGGMPECACVAQE
jgi:hypothetical protein